MNDKALLRKLAAGFRARAAESWAHQTCGPFEAFFSETSDDYLMNFATPTTEDADWAALPELLSLFEARGRRPRLEFFAELQPGLQGALERAGLKLDMAAAPVMALPRSGSTPAEVCARAVAAEDLEAVNAMEAVQAAAYGDMLTPDAQAAYRPILLERLARGGLFAVVVEAEGRAVATAMVMGGGGDVAELVGVASLPDVRGRGHGETACCAALQAYFDAGGELAWLSAAPGAQGLYARLGFLTVGSQLNMGVGAAS